MVKVRLTDRNALSAKADPGQRLEMFDQTVVGLILRISDTGRKSWAVRYRTMDGMQRRHAIGRYPETSLAEAREVALDVLKAARSGRDPTAEKTAKKREAQAQPIKTMSDLHDAYFAACETGEWRPRNKRKRESTIREEKGLWRRHLLKAVGDVRVEEVTVAGIRKVLRSLVQAGHGTTSNRVRALLRQMFNFAIAEERIETNPVDKIAAMAAEKPRERVLSDDELRALWGALSTRVNLRKTDASGEPVAVHIGEAMAVAIKIQAMTLTRRAEVAGMRRSELDLAAGTWTIPSERAKNGKTHLVPLPAPTITLLRRAIEIADEGKEGSSPFVFPSPRNRDRPITPESVSHALRDVRLALGMKDARTHDLRRTGASLMASERLGITPFVIGRLLNHSSETGGAAAVTLRHYALHDYAVEKRQAITAWVELIREIVGEAKRSHKVVSIRGAA